MNNTQLKFEYIKCVPWIASQTYEKFTKYSRSVISNEKTHEFLVLEGHSSDLWKMITDECSFLLLEKYAKEHDIETELESFLQELHEASLILLIASESSSFPDPVPAPKKMDAAKNINAELDMMQWVQDHGYLWHVFWEITYRCNEKCLHCFNPGAAHSDTEKPDRNREELTTEEAYKLIDDLVDLGVFRLTLSGGEISLRKDFFDILKYARSKRLCVDVFTNGLLFKEEKLDELIAMWPHKVSISLYSADATSHDKITKVPESHTRSISVLKYLNKKGVKTAVKSIQMKHTVSGYMETQNLAVNLGAGFQLDMAMTPGVDGDAAPLDLAVDNLGELVVLAATPESPTYIGNVKNPTQNMLKDKDMSVCGAGRTILNIDPTGTVSPCNTLPITLGKVQHGGIKSIWYAASTQKRLVSEKSKGSVKVSFSQPSKTDNLSEWKSICLSNFHECGTHERCKWCQMCPGLSLLEKGDMLAPSDVNCRLAYSRLVARKLIREGLSRSEICQRYDIPEDFGYLSGGLPFNDPVKPKVQRIQFNPGSRAHKTLNSVRND